MTVTFQAMRCVSAALPDGVMVITDVLPKVIVTYEGSINSS